MKSSMVSALSSTPVHFRPVFWAMARVVPEPTKQSRTVSPCSVAAELRAAGRGVG